MSRKDGNAYVTGYTILVCVDNPLPLYRIPIRGDYFSNNGKVGLAVAIVIASKSSCVVSLCSAASTYPSLLGKAYSPFSLKVKGFSVFFGDSVDKGGAVHGLLLVLGKILTWDGVGVMAVVR